MATGGDNVEDAIKANKLVPDNPDKLAELEEVLAEAVKQADQTGPCKASLETIAKSIPAVMDASIQQALEVAAAQHAPNKFIRMPSGAGHDAQIVARHLPAGMMFVPSIGGISHHWTENTSDEDLMLGAEVYTDAIARMLGFTQITISDGKSYAHQVKLQ